MSHYNHNNHNLAWVATRVARWIAAVLIAVSVCVLAATVTSKTAQAQDACSSGNFSVSPCRTETHVSSGGVAQFTVYNYAYADDAYQVSLTCGGIVYGCTGGGYHYVGAYSTVDVDIPFSVSQQSGTGSAGADISSVYLGGEAQVSETVYGQPALVIDSAQTPVTAGIAQDVSRCATNCFTATASVSTVPFYTLGQARGVTLVYNDDRAHARSFIYAGVSPAADGPAVSQYLFSATLNGAAVTFVNGEQTLHFSSPGNQPVRLGGQVSLPGGPALYTLVVNVLVQYANGNTAPITYSTLLAVNDGSDVAIARGWTIAGVQRLECPWEWTQGCMITEGDGSLTVFPLSTYTNGGFTAPSDHSILWWDGLAHWNRRYLDQSLAQFDQYGRLTSITDPYGRVTTFAYNGFQLVWISDPIRAGGQASVQYWAFTYNAAPSGNRLASIVETGGTGPVRTTFISVDGSSSNLTAFQDPDGQATHFAYDGSNRLSVTTDRRGANTYYGYDALGKLASITAPSIPVDAGGGSTTSATPVTYYTAWQGIGVPTTPTASAPPTAALLSSITATVQAPGNRTTQFSVNAWGQPTATVDPSGQQTVITYDGNNNSGTNSGKNPVSVEHPDWSQDSFAYDGLDRLVMSKPAGDSATYYHYNAASQVDSVWGQNAVATGYHYNADNTLMSTSDASGVTMSYTYNG